MLKDAGILLREVPKMRFRPLLVIGALFGVCILWFVGWFLYWIGGNKY